MLGALAIQVACGVAVLYWETGKEALQATSSGVQAIIDSSKKGIDLLFGPVLPVHGPGFAFQMLPIIIFFATPTSVLYHWHIPHWVVKILGGPGALQVALGSKAESTFATPTIFVGMSEAPLVGKPYIERATSPSSSP